MQLSAFASKLNLEIATPEATVRDLASHMKACEERFVSTMDSIRNQLSQDTSARSRADAFRRETSPQYWQVEVSKMLLERCVDRFRLSLTDENKRSAENEVRKVSSLPQSLWSMFFDKITNQLATPNKEGRPTFIWDFLIIAVADKGLSVDGQPILLVTSDREMLSAADAADQRDSLVDYDNYRERLRASSLAIAPR